MSKNRYVQVRVSNYEKTFLHEGAKSLGVNVSHIMRTASIEYLKRLQELQKKRFKL